MMFQLLAGAAVAGAMQWEQMPLRTDAMRAAGLFGGDGFQQVYGLSYAPSNPDRVYASIDCAQVWRSTDGGANWHRAAAGFRATGGLDLAVDPVNEDVVYVAGGLGRPEAADVDGVYRTLDGGQNWERVQAAQFYKLEGARGGSFFWIDPQSESGGRCLTVYAADQGGERVLRSDDGGAFWTNIGISGLGYIHDFQRNPFRDEFWVSTDSGVVVVAPAGGGYSQYPLNAAGLPAGSSNAVSRIRFNTENSNTVYALCGTAGFYKSTDGGATFSVRNSGIPAHFSGTRTASMLDMNPLNPDWLILGFHETAYGNFMSFDGGETWEGFPSMDPDGMIADLDLEGKTDSFYVGHKTAFHPTNRLEALIPGTVWDMRRTVDGGATWTFSGNGFCGARVGVTESSFGFPLNRPEEIDFFCIDYGPFRSSNSGETFGSMGPLRINGARTTPVGAVHPNDPDTVICPSGHWGEQKLIMTTNAGVSWDVVCDTLANYRFCAYHPQDPDVVYADSHCSTNGGKTWAALSRPVRDVFPTDGDRVYSYEVNAGVTTVYMSTNRGSDWTQLGTSVIGGTVQEIAVAPDDPDRVYVPTAQGLYIYDHGTWQCRNEHNGLPRDWFGNYALRNVVVHPNDPRILYLSRLNSRKGHSDGIWRSQDRGLSWTNITGNLGPELSVWALGIDPRHDRIYIGTSHGTWYAPAGGGMILAAWDGAADTAAQTGRAADRPAAGFDAGVSWGTGESWVESAAGSDDLSFGRVPSARLSTNVSTGVVLSKTADAFMDFSITNGTLQSYQLTRFCFDAWRSWAGGASNFVISVVSGGVSTGVVCSGTFTAQGANPQTAAAPDYEDFEISLTGLEDPALAPGESAVIRLAVSDSRPQVGDVYIDNVAIIGMSAAPDVIPLAVWDGAADTASAEGRAADRTADRMDAFVYWGADEHWIESGAGSDDFTCGSHPAAVESVDVATGVLLNKVHDAVLEFTLINNSAQHWELTEFCFDAWRSFPGQTEGCRLSIADGDLNPVACAASGTFAVQGGTAQSFDHPDYQDIDMDLVGLSDRVLAPGEHVTFALVMEDDRLTAHDVYIDNVMIRGRAAER